jgi:hypothetical protein
MKYTTREAAEYLGISYYYLRNMRHELHNHDGPKFTVEKGRRGPTCMYDQEDLEEWKQSHTWKDVNKELS